MQLPAERLARVSKRGRNLHIIDWRKEANGSLPPSMCDLILRDQPRTADITLPLCKACLKAEELLRQEAA